MGFFLHFRLLAPICEPGVGCGGNEGRYWVPFPDAAFKVTVNGRNVVDLVGGRLPSETANSSCATIEVAGFSNRSDILVGPVKLIPSRAALRPMGSLLSDLLYECVASMLHQHCGTGRPRVCAACIWHAWIRWTLRHCDDGA